jgi:hypothetical protein
MENMPTKKKRIEIVSETSTLLILKNSNIGARHGWCGQCGAEVIWIAPTAICMFGISDSSEIGAVHTNGDEICSRSLIQQIKKGETQ